MDVRSSKPAFNIKSLENLLFVMGLWEVLENIPTMGHEKNPDDSFKPGRKLWDPVREKR